MLLTGRILVVVSIGLMFLACSNFVPTALTSKTIADYVKNHFVREVIFGLCLAILTIYLTLTPLDEFQVVKIAVLGSVVVLPFWIATAIGWSTGGLEDVWGDNIKPQSAYLLHGAQVIMFYIGLLAMTVGVS